MSTGDAVAAARSFLLVSARAVRMLVLLTNLGVGGVVDRDGQVSVPGWVGRALGGQEGKEAIVDLVQAMAAAERDLPRLEDPPTPLAFTGLTLERSWCRVFFYDSRAYLETDDYRELLAGNGSIVVNKDGGEVWHTGTAYPAERYLDEYAEKHGLRLQ